MIELIVVIGIICVAAIICFPAVVQSRASGRKLECVSNLKQIGDGLAIFETAHSKFPGVYSGFTGSPNRKYKSVSPLVAIAGFCYGQSYGESASKAESEINQYNINSAAKLVSPKIYRCPEDGKASSYSSNYRFCRGVLPLWPADPGGVFVREDQGFSVADITDGLSNTSFCSERLVDVSNGTNQTRPSSGIIENNSKIANIAQFCLNYNQKKLAANYSSESSGTQWTSGRWIDVSYYHLYRPNSEWMDCRNGGTLAMAVLTPRAWHLGGVNVLNGDGSVRFVMNNVALEIWRAMATRAGKD